MSSELRKVRLGDVLRKSDDVIWPAVESRYTEVTVRLWGRGVVSRGEVDGLQLAGQRRFRARRGQFIASRIDARNGALGIVPAHLDGAIVTNDFPLFDVCADRLEPTFLGWLSRTERFVDLCRRASEGTTNRVRLKEDRFLSLEISLPPLDEQRRLAQQMDAVAMRVQEAQTLHDEIEETAADVCRSILAGSKEIQHVRLGSLLALRPTDVTVQPDERYQFAGVYSFGRGVFRSVHKAGSEFTYDRLTRLRAGDFVYPKLMAWEGALGVVPPECDGCVVSPEFPTFEVDQKRVLSDVIDVHFRTPAVWRDVAALSTGTNVRRRRVHPREFLTYAFPLPDMETQKRMVEVRRALTTAAVPSTSARAQLDSLVPAVMNGSLGAFV